METSSFHLSERQNGVVLAADYQDVQQLLEDSLDWGIETMRMGGIPDWVLQSITWSSWLRSDWAAHEKPGGFWVQYGVGHRGVLAYRIQRAAEGQIRVSPAFAIPSNGLLRLLIPLGWIIPGVLSLPEWLEGKRLSQTRKRSLRYLREFCRYLQYSLARSSGDYPSVS